MTRVSVIAVAFLLPGCPKDDPSKADASASTAPPPATSSVAPQASGAPSASPAPAAGAAASYEGKYTATPATLYIPSDNKEYSGVKQANDEGTTMVGDGTMTLAVDGSGRVTGTIDSGPAQGSLVDGTIADGSLSGTVRVKSPGDNGLHGSMLGKMTADGIEGTMKLADATAAVLRDVKFTATKKK